MPSYVIERSIPGADQMTGVDLRAAQAHLLEALRELGPEIQWVGSYLAGNKVFCLYVARSSQVVHDRARRAGFPAERICEVKPIVDPLTPEPWSSA